MKPNQICVDCGKIYDYDPGFSQGASSERCPSCQRRKSRTQLKYELLRSAAPSVCCRRCGYHESSDALGLVSTRSFFPSEPRNDDDRRDRARYAVILCLNCQASHKTGDLKMRIIDSTCIPPQVSFYLETVTVTHQPLSSLTFDPDALKTEIVYGPNPHPIRPTQRVAKAIGTHGPIVDVPAVSSQSDDDAEGLVQ